MRILLITVILVASAAASCDGETLHQCTLAALQCHTLRATCNRVNSADVDITVGNGKVQVFVQTEAQYGACPCCADRPALEPLCGGAAAHSCRDSVEFAYSGGCYLAIRNANPVEDAVVSGSARIIPDVHSPSPFMMNFAAIAVVIGVCIACAASIACIIVRGCYGSAGRAPPRAGAGAGAESRERIELMTAEISGASDV